MNMLHYARARPLGHGNELAKKTNMSRGELGLDAGP